MLRSLTSGLSYSVQLFTKLTELRPKCFYSSANVIYQQISRQIRLQII